MVTGHIARSLILSGLIAASLTSLSAQQTSGRFLPARSVPQVTAGPKALLARIATAPRSAISLAAGDFFEDGAKALVTGYAVADGGVIAVQRGAALPSISDTAGSPFSSSANLIDIGLRPDFLQSTDINGDGHQDLVAATRGGSSFVVLQGDGRGGFTPQSPVTTSGPINSVAAWKNIAGEQKIAVGVCNSGCSVEFYNADGSKYAAVPLESEPKILQAARINGGAVDDLIVGDSSALSVISGQQVGSSSPQVDRLPVSGAVAVAAGSFVFDRRNGVRQIAVLTSDGSVHILARTGLVPTPAAGSLSMSGGRGHSTATPEFVDPSSLTWFDAETDSGIAVPDSGATPILLNTRMSGSGMDDLLALNVNGGGRVAIGHAILPSIVQPDQARQAPQVLPARVTNEGSFTAPVMAALPVRVSQDARLGLVTAESTAQPMIAALGAYHTYNVNTITDGQVTAAVTTACTNGTAGCSLRGAMTLVNTDASAAISAGKADTINLPAGTYTLSYSAGGEPDGNGNYNYHMEVNGPFNLIGVGSSSTTITMASNVKDKLFSINPGYSQSQIPFDVFFSNLTLENGTNENNGASNGSANDVGGLLDYDTTGTGYITFANCTFSGGTAPYGEGGGIYVSDNIEGNGSTGPGTLEVDGGTFSNNSSAERGGAISTATSENLGNVPIVINGVTFTGNSVNHLLNAADTNTTGYGGAIDFVEDKIAGVTPTILNSTFTGNSTTLDSGHGYSEGGALYAASGMTITNSIFTGNTTVTSGGAIEMIADDYAATLTGLTITGNTSGDVGGVEIDATGGKAATLQYSRISGNTGSATRSGLGVGASGETDAESAVAASYNFWGCNGAATGTGCNTAAASPAGSTLTLTPYAQVTASLNTMTPAPGSTLTLSGGITTDSTNAALSNVNAFTGVTGGTSVTTSGVTVTNPGGQVSAVSTITENSTTLKTATAPTTVTAAATPLSTTVTLSGSGAGTVKIDNATATVNFTVTVISPTISIAFAPTSIALNGSSTLTFTLANPNSGVALNGVAFTDALPSGLLVAVTPAVSDSCGGTVTAAAGSGTISLSGSTINASSNCTISVSVTGTTAGAKPNTTGAITATNETASGTTSNTATLTVYTPPTVTGLSPTSGPTAGGGTITITGTNFAGPATVAFGAVPATNVTVVNATTITATIPAGSAGKVYVTVTTPGGTSANSSQYLYIGAIGSFTVTGFPTTAILTEAGNVTVSALDVNGNPDPYFTGTVTLTSSDPLAVFTPTSYTYLSGDNGVHTFTATLRTLGTQSITATSGVATGSQTGIVASDAIWALNPAGTLGKLNDAGSAIVGPVGTAGTTSTSGGLAFNSTGNVWSVISGTNTLKFIGKLGTGPTSYTGGGLNAPKAIAVDGVGQIWIANSTGNSVSVFSNTGTAISPVTTGYQAGYSGPAGIAIDLSGNVWISNSIGNTVNEIIGGAAPVAPLATAVTNSTTGVRP